MANNMELAVVIAGLRAELEKAQEAGKGKKLKFGVKGMEVELDVAIVKAVQGEASASVGMEADDMNLLRYVVGKVKGEISINGQGKYEKVASQKVKLLLDVTDETGNNPNLSKTGEKRR